MEDSILKTIKKMLGLDPDYEYFDTDIIVHINSVLAILSQMGIGDTNFTITGDSETWDDFITLEKIDYEMVKSYMYFKVKAMFDPATSSAVSTANDAILKELEVRLYMAANF